MLRTFSIRGQGGLWVWGEVDETSPGFYTSMNPHENEEREYELKTVYLDDAEFEITKDNKHENPIFEKLWGFAEFGLEDRYEEIIDEIPTE